MEFEDGHTEPYREFEMTMFAPFTRHNFHEAEVGNIIYSAMIISCEGFSAFNANDNIPTPDACSRLREQFGTVDLAMLNYNSAGPYPSCFNNQSNLQKKSEHKKILQRYFDYLCELLEVISPRPSFPLLVPT